MIIASKQRELIAALSELIPAAQTETQAVDEAAAVRLGINRTDLRCLGTIAMRGSLSASKLAESIGLTRGAMTTALDRLEQAGFIRRIHDRLDRRSITVEATPAATKAIREIWEPIRVEGLALLQAYGDAELELLSRFFKDYCALQQTHATRIRRPKQNGPRNLT